MDLGFDRKAIYRDLVFAIPMKEGVGTKLNDYAKSSLRHTMTATGTPTWTTLANGLQVLDFNSATPDYFECSATGSSDLDFTSGDFSVCLWSYFDALGTIYAILNRGLINSYGYSIYKDANDAIVFNTSQAGASQETKTANSAVAINTWYMILVARVGATARIYINGKDLTNTMGVHINPLTTSRPVGIGVM